MKIVINALPYRPDGSGIAVCLRELFGAFMKLTHRPTQLILPKDSPDFPCPASIERVEGSFSYEQGLRRLAFQSFTLGRKYGANALLLTVDSRIPLFLPRSCRVIPLITDLAVFRLPETYQASRVLLWRLQYALLRRRAERFLAISDFTKREMTDILGISPERINVIPCAPRPAIEKVGDTRKLKEFTDRYRLKSPYILFVGNFNPRKNLRRLIRAFDRMKSETALPHELVIAGGVGWKFDPGEALHGIASKKAIRFLDYVPDADMAALYSAASLFTFPTLYEGFGIPVLEAQKCGVPVLSSRVSALPDTGGDGAIYVDPYDEEEMAFAMERLLTDQELRAELIQKGFQNAARYSWEKSAQKLCQIIDRKVVQ